ncbi:hypothetical protein VI06_07925 [Aquitalea magnusonii]|jgi:uncharacterized protein (DUF2249 family)|uniref:DUF2249 domain-containing protein n=1 Tax=Aquitalea TaxID=407217 RepID=UPI0005F7D191|nr:MULTISPECIES: DUF2249 domain-containing protein [unclassified Aquitalea]KJV30661.1 hypothetical protein VI06_07925 [Aquitalea magnusonii]NWK78889.1 DUF2249 domain-containing protein [Aquitalea sp. LB_tupeE]QBJ78954.1 DUF2249 domain-containing protein [Aquitalea sp. USM4]
MSPRDLRQLPPPQPMEIILDEADGLAPGQQAAYILPHHPSPLLPLLQQQGLDFRFELSGDGGVILILSRP